MEFGVSLLGKVTDFELAHRAEQLGYDQIWFGDIPMVSSDLYINMALAATHTTSIRIGAGVAVADTRLAPVHAQGVATVAQLAPGRVELGFGTGNSAPLSMGMRPVKLDRLKKQVRLIRRLLRGETAALHVRDRETPVRFLHPDRGYVNLDPPIPLALSAIGPKTLRFCGEEADAHMTYNLSPEQLVEARQLIAEGAEQAGRNPDQIPSKAIVPVAVLGEDESPGSERVLQWMGPFVTNYLHYFVEYKQRRPSGRSLQKPSPEVHEVIDEYLAYAKSLPEDEYHLTLHRGHASFVREEEKKFITPEIVQAVALVGTPESLIEQIRDMEEAGLSHFALCCTPDDRANRSRTIERFARDVISRFEPR